MKIVNAFIAFLWTLAISVEFSKGSVYVRRVLNVGDNMTLDCVTDWDPDIDMYWARRKNGLDDYIAQAGTSYPKGEIYGKFRHDPRISVSYYIFVNVSSDKVSKILALSISNITEQDSSEYICFATNVPNSKTIYLYFYNIRVVTCNCSIDSNVMCDLIGFNSAQWQPVTTIVNGRSVKPGVNGNRLIFGLEHINEMAIEHSIHVSSDDGLMSNITCILPVQSNPSSAQRTTTTVLPSQPRQSSAQGTTRIIDRTNEPSSYHEFLGTLATSLQYTQSTTMSPRSGTQRYLRPSSSPPFSRPSSSYSSEMVPLETSSSLIPSPPRTTENVEIQATSSTKIQEQTDSTIRIKTISSATPKSSLAVNESNTTMSAISSSPSQPVSTVRTSISSKEAQPRHTPSQQTASPSIYTAPMTNSSERDESSTTDMTTKPNTKRPSPQPEKTSKSSLATLSTSGRTNQKTIKEESDFNNNNNLIIPLCVSISAGVIFMAVIIVMAFRRRYYKSSNVGGSNTSRKGRAKATGERLQTLSTTIPDFNFQPSAMKTCRLNDEESSHGHYHVDFQTQQALSPDTLNSRKVERSDSRVALSDKGSTQNVMHASAGIPMKELKDSHGQDTPGDNLYFVLENDSTNYSPNGNPCTHSCVKPHQMECASYEPSNNKCEASDESIFVDNVLYESSDAVTMAMKGKQGQNADEANLYFVLENDNLYSPPTPFDSHLEEDPDAGPSGHQYEDIDTTRKLVEGGARCSTPIYAMPDELSKTITNARMNACGKGYPLDTMKGVNDTSSASMASESTVDVGPLYAQID